MIHVCMTASLRAETIARTLGSFREYVNVGDHRVKWFVNIDQAGDGTVEEVWDMFGVHGIHVHAYVPEKPNLNAALRWCYRASDAPFFYMTEDDVEFRAPFDLAGAVEEFTRHDRLAYLAVPRCPFPNDDRAGLNNGPTEGNVTWRTGKYRMCLGPGLLSSEFAVGAAELMHDALDPEFQFHRDGQPLAAWVSKWRFATYSVGYNEYPTCGNGCRHPIWDIGRAYRDTKGFKWRDTPEGTVWVKA